MSWRRFGRLLAQFVIGAGVILLLSMVVVAGIATMVHNI